MKLRTKILDRAAFLMCYGAQLALIKGHYPNCNFVLEGPVWLTELQQQCRTVDYKKFCEKRRVIKRRARREAGLPAHFTGETKKFTFMEVAHTR